MEVAPFLVRRALGAALALLLDRTASASSRRLTADLILTAVKLHPADFHSGDRRLTHRQKPAGTISSRS